ncbi:MAG: DUF58 domain-containing protein, partial [Planctomycetota bacterium]
HGTNRSEPEVFKKGDDFRHIDWAVWARHGDLLIRRFLEDANLAMHLVLDASMSMSVGQPSKWDAARRIVAGISYVALARLDEVQVSTFSETLSEPFRISRSAQMNVLFALLTNLKLSEGRGSFDRAVDHFLGQRRPAGVVVCLSDFMFVDRLSEGLARLRHAGHEVQLLQITAAEEASPEIGSFTLVDAETAETRDVVVDRDRQQQYQGLFEDFLHESRQDAHRQGCRLIHVTSDVPAEQAIIRWLGAHEFQSP